MSVGTSSFVSVGTSSFVNVGTSSFVNAGTSSFAVAEILNVVSEQMNSGNVENSISRSNFVTLRSESGVTEAWSFEIVATLIVGIWSWTRCGTTLNSVVSNAPSHRRRHRRLRH